MEEFECNCGFIIRGKNQTGLEQNKRVHLGSKRHKEYMELKNRKAQRKI